MAKQAKQIPFELPHKPSFDMADFIVSASNEAAFSLIDSWPEWPHHAVALVGPKACGKTHLAKAWASRANAIEYKAEDDIAAIPAGASVLVEVLDVAKVNQETLFHLFNWSKETSGYLLITASIPPNRWDIPLADLRSRLATLPVAEIVAPDDHLLMVLMAKLFADRQLQVDLEVIDYILKRMDRSFVAAKALVELLDRHALADKRKITKPLAKACLEELLDR